MKQSTRFLNFIRSLVVFWGLLFFFTAIGMALAPPLISGEPPAPPPFGTPDDLDHDGLLNSDELMVGTDPENPDSDGDDIRDGVDPDILSSLIEQLPQSAFKSQGQGSRTAILKQLKTNERYLLDKRIDLAVQSLERLKRHMDGCSPTADKDDWIIDCQAQEEARRFLDILLANHSSVCVNEEIIPEVTELPGLGGGPKRPVGIVLGPDGTRESFVINEVLIHPETPEELQEFLLAYGGIILRDGTPRLIPGNTPKQGVPQKTGWYLIAVNPSLSATNDLPANMEQAGILGEWTFSSDAALETASIVARETRLSASLNFTMELAEPIIKEHPDNSGGYYNAAAWPWMTEDDDPGQPGDQGLSVGVVHAWEYLRYKGYPPVDAPYTPVKFALVDAGFDLDEATGDPLYGAQDFPFDLPQLDEVGNDWTAGGIGYGFPNCKNGCWHGHLSYGVSCAFSQNLFGTAGSSGGWDVKPLLIKVTGDMDTVTSGIYNAVYNGADVIHDAAQFDCGWWCRTFGDGGAFKAVVKTCKNVGAIFITPANNHGKDISGSDYMPCNLDGAVCVGAVDRSGNAMSYSNWGTIVDTWAPTDILSTISRISAARDADDVGEDELHQFGGTSASGPYLSGIVALMKMLNPNLSYNDVRGILVSTANPSKDPKVKDRGYVDAFRAVMAAAPNLPPTVEILAPAHNSTEAYANIFFKARVTDPETPSPLGVAADFSSSLTFTSDKDGLLCQASDDATDGGTVIACEAQELSLGNHQITATAKDPFGGTATDIINITVINTPPTVKITYPADGATYYTQQQINFRGYAFDEEVYGYIPLTWSSNLSGSLSTSQDFWTALVKGDHVITLKAVDEKGTSASDSIVVHVKEGVGGIPSVQITHPANGATFAPGATITFSGQATDPEDGTITTDAAYTWSSDEDGVLGTGKTIQSSLSDTGEAKNHLVTLEVTDSDGNKATHQIGVTILNPQ